MGPSIDSPEVIEAVLTAIESKTGRGVTIADLRAFLSTMQEAYLLLLVKRVMGKEIEDED